MEEKQSNNNTLRIKLRLLLYYRPDYLSNVQPAGPRLSTGRPVSVTTVLYLTVLRCCLRRACDSAAPALRLILLNSLRWSIIAVLCTDICLLFVVFLLSGSCSVRSAECAPCLRHRKTLGSSLNRASTRIRSPIHVSQRATASDAAPTSPWQDSIIARLAAQVSGCHLIVTLSLASSPG